MARAERDQGLPLRLGDVVITSMATLVVAYMVIAGRWVPGAWTTIIAFTIIGLGPPVLRWLSHRYPRSRLLDIAASFWLIPSAVLGHETFRPVVDAINPRLLDAQLALADERLFGFSPAVWLSERAIPVVTELLLICYYSYFVWPFVLGVFLYAKKRREAFDETLLGLSVFFSLNFILYVTVPAIGPRFFMADHFSQPLQGVWLTPLLDGLMRQANFMGDCFPSGHTGITLVTLTYAFLYARRVFWIMLGPALGLIAATLVGRFHYGVDLLCALPLVPAVVMTCNALMRARPEGVRVKKPAFDFREPAKA